MKCNLCNSEKIEELYSFKTHKIMRCKNCNLMFTDQDSIKAKKEELYDDKYFTEVHPQFFGDCSYDYENKKSKKVDKFRKGIKLIEKYSSKGKILDLGCATGVFLDIAKKRGWNSKGVDISKYAAEYAKKNFNLDVKQGELEKIKFPAKSFDVVTMWDFIEHVPDPKSILDETNRILKPKGIILVLTTNEQSLMCWLADTLYKLRIRFFARLVHPIHHNYHFSEKTLTNLLKKTGFTIIYKEKDEMPIENIEGSPIIRFMARILYLFSRITKTQHEIMVIARKNDSEKRD